MKIAVLTIIVLLSAHLSFGQVIKIQAGPSISNLKWSIENFEQRGSNKYLIGTSAFVGIDYLNRRHFNLSSNIGYLRKGDQSEIAYTDDEGEILELPMIKAWFDYLSVNTLAEIKVPLWSKVIPSISVGPRIDYLFSHTEDFNFIEEIDELPDYFYGLNLGGGIKFDFQRIQLGIRSDYYLNMRKMAEWGSKSEEKASWIYDETVLINFTFGYKLRKF